MAASRSAFLPFRNEEAAEQANTIESLPLSQFTSLHQLLNSFSLLSSLPTLSSLSSLSSLPSHPLAFSPPPPPLCPGSSSFSTSSSSSTTPLTSPARRLAQPIPQEKKDAAYFERRRRNNDSARRSRDARRRKEEAVALRARHLMSENEKLRQEKSALVAEIEHLRDGLSVLSSVATESMSLQLSNANGILSKTCALASEKSNSHALTKVLLSGEH